MSIKKLSFGGRALLLCYAAALGGYLLWGLFGWGGDALRFATGRISTQTLSAGQFELYDIAVTPEGQLITTGADAQMIYAAQGVEVRSISYVLKNAARGEISLYYTKPGQSDFSRRQMVLPPYGENRSVVYLLPRFGKTEKIRLDVSSYSADRLDFESITLNPRLPVWRYFALTGAQAAMLLLAPCLAASALAYLYHTAGQPGAFRFKKL